MPPVDWRDFYLIFRTVFLSSNLPCEPNENFIAAVLLPIILKQLPTQTPLLCEGDDIASKDAVVLSVHYF